MDSVKKLLATGKQHFDNKQYKQAEHIFRRVLDEDTRYADVYNMMGVIAHVDGRFATAIECFQQALDINPRYTEALLNLAVLYNDLGQYDEAKKLYAQLKRGGRKGQTTIEPVLRGKLSNLHADIGDIYRSIGLYGHSIEEYRKALDLNAAYLDIRTKLGQALREHGKPQESLKELRSVLRTKASYAPALIQLGITAYTLGRVADARKSWQAVLKKDPRNEYALMYLRLCEVTENTQPKKAAKKPTTKKTSVKAKKKVKKASPAKKKTTAKTKKKK